MTDNPKEHWLEVHVFGASSKGEGIIVKLPDGRFGVVDCCFRGDITDHDSNPLVCFLRQRNVQKLAFVCLTHPHDDHFFGLSHIVDLFNPEEFWLPDAMRCDSLKKIVLASYVDAKRYADDKASDQAKELQKIFELATKKSRKRGGGLEFRFAGTQTHLFPSPLPTSPVFEAIAFSPCGSEKIQYENSLKLHFDNGVLKTDTPNLRHNKISLGLIFRSKKFSVVLGADVEQKNWESAMKQFSPEWWENVVMVKVSHHGSPTGYNSPFWDSSKNERRRIAIVTGYKSSGLPRQHVLRQIADRTKELYCTHSEALVPKESDVVQNPISAEALGALASHFGVSSPLATLSSVFRRVVKEPPVNYGRC